MGINGVSSYANTYTYGNVKNENVKPSKNSDGEYIIGCRMPEDSEAIKDYVSKNYCE